MHQRVVACIIGFALLVAGCGAGTKVVASAPSPPPTLIEYPITTTTTVLDFDLEDARYVQTVAAIRFAAAHFARQRLLDATTADGTIAPARHSQQVQYGTGACGGDLPPCWVMMRESGGNIRAKNPSSSASGKWQMLDSTWNGYGGYAHAMDAPESVQDAKARSLGICHWTPPNYCAG